MSACSREIPVPVVTAIESSKDTREHDRSRALADWLEEPLYRALGDIARHATLEHLVRSKEIADGATTVLVRGRSGRPIAFVMISSRSSPDLVGRGVDRAGRAKDRLGSRLGRKILDPIGHGAIEGLSYAIFPFRQPLGQRGLRRRWQRAILRPGLYRWLYEATKQTMRTPDADELEDGFVRPLRHVVNLGLASDRVRTAAENAIRRLSDSSWKPRFVLMHGDLWMGNVLLADRRAEGNGLARGDRFVIIDWPGARIDGYAIFDVVRLWRSVGPSQKYLGRELSRYCHLLDCAPVDALGYQLAAAGWIGMNLEQYEPERYLRMLEYTSERLGVALRLDD